MTPEDLAEMAALVMVARKMQTVMTRLTDVAAHADINTGRFARFIDRIEAALDELEADTN